MRRENLIIDVGMHTGEDTRRFLAAGFDVVAVEANPEIVETTSEVFAAEIDRGQLQIVNAAVAEQRGSARFGISSNSIWSSLDPEMIERNERFGNASYRYIDVEAIPFQDVLNRFGMPYYLKVDIEGHDMLCIRALRDFDSRPACVSLESHVSINEAPSEAVFDEVAVLWTLGYRRFRYVSQLDEDRSIPCAGGWSGPPWRSPWAALARAQALRAHHNFAGLGGRWANTVPAKSYRAAKTLMNRGPQWYDLQATEL